MKAALLYGPQDIRVEDVSEPRINKGEVLIKPHRVGIWGSDLNRYRSDWITGITLDVNGGILIR